MFMARSGSLPILIPLAFLLVSSALASEDTCADRSIVAGAVRTPQDAKTLTRCAYEFVQEVGFEEAHRAFKEEERWKSGPIYVFVSEVTPVSDRARVFVFPPDPSLEGLPFPWQIDSFGNDYFKELHRLLTSFDEGWNYYSFINPATGEVEPKVSYVKSIDWMGTPAAIGVGVYRRDLPGTCRSEEVNAAMLDSDPSEARLQEFVRCAAMELDSKGYFASVSLANDPRWRSGSIYLFGLDTYGYTFFSGSPADSWIGSELSSSEMGGFEGRHVLGVADAFGETFLYYSNGNPATNQLQRKVTFVKRVISFGVPVLIGAGYYLDEGVPPVPGVPADDVAFTVDFHRGPQGFMAGFADYPPADAQVYELTSDYRKLPPPLESESALFISGVNRSDDLFMFFKGPISGLLPGAQYRVTVGVEIATDTPSGCVGVGGAPGESVWIKAGVTAVEPLAVPDGSYLRMNVDVGNQSRGGAQAVVLGDIANSRSCEQSRRWERKSYQGQTTPTPISVAPDGRAWLLFSADSGFESRTSIYFTRASVTLTPI